MLQQFEEGAEGVLDECYQEDSERTRLLVNKKLRYYGGTSVIRLAARGQCIRFMSYPCCQELLSEVWMGALSPKNTNLQIALGVLMGMSMPLLLPNVVRYVRTDITYKSNQDGVREISLFHQVSKLGI
ncbi:unnamed protein product [Protopolystoma xenopodis]|uniref:TRPM-like domain-containing protein n=1 Tax=Protopolystoma xenopodis TaxID=117903 RepID=A0A448WHY3_9PLAT|nr:unnamed protein product [Protopolystoma xenopodis]